MQRDIAVIGMVCCVPGAQNTQAFWEMLKAGEEGIRTLTQAELERLQIEPHQHYVAAGGFIEDVDLFDADYFSYTAREAALMDPQHRLWLQACWQALEITGHASGENLSIGVFASTGPNSYLKNILLNPSYSEQHQAMLLGNVPDCLATRVSYTLNLTGPSMTIQCGCSSSLVGLHQARLALLAKQCDAALVGGICLTIPSPQGYTYIEGGFASPDGHCRPFSDDAAGTVFSSGYGVVVVKRLEDALAQGDQIYAIIKGSAINNDGSDKASFTAPSVHGQASVIAKALRVAGVTADDIQYIETHGTGTPIGDPIELAALEQAFQESTKDHSKMHTIGSVKANVGHLDVAAGIVSFIKTCLMLHHKNMPPQIHFRKWNTKCLSAQTKFQVNTQLIPWEASHKRLAGVSAFGFGGTNAHVIVEEAPTFSSDSRRHPILSKLIVLSAKSSARLLACVKSLREYLLSEPDIALEQLAYTLQVGRKQQAYRFLVEVNSVSELIQVLQRVTEADFVACQRSADLIKIHDKSKHEIIQTWLSGCTINWKEAYSGMQMKKAVLPASPLQPESYWIEPAKEKNKETHSSVNLHQDYAKWLYQSVWQEKIVAPSKEWNKLQPIAIFSCGNEPLTEMLVNFCQRHHLHYYLITVGECYQQLSENHFQIHPKNSNDYQKLEQSWQGQRALPELVILNLSIQELSEQNGDSQQIVFNLIRMNQCMRHMKQLATLVVGMSRLQCHDDQPSHALLTAFSRGIGQEFPNIKTQFIDLDPAESTQNLQHVLDSIYDKTLNDVCVWRDNKCWQQTYQMQPDNSASHSDYFKKDGVYIITGGLGDVASVHVEYLAAEFQAKLILLGKTPIPKPDDWDRILNQSGTDLKLRKKILRLQEWKNKGYSVFPFSGDVTDREAMHKLYQKCISDFGNIDGVIHIAGAGSDMHYKILAETDWQHCWKLFAPKLKGIEILASLSHAFSIKNCLIISSISSALTGIGLSAYGATHNLLDAIVSKHYPHWRIMNWDAWNFYQNEQKKHGELGSEIDKLAIKPNDGLEILKYAFRLPHWQQLYVSSGDLTERHRYWAHRGFLKKMHQSNTKHPRPALPTEYVAPHSPLQQRLAGVWQSLLGIDKVGIHDSFFELGGHSLLALELINTLQTEFNCSLSVVDLFGAPTIAQLTNKLEQSNPASQSVVSELQTRIGKQLAARRVIQSNRET